MRCENCGAPREVSDDASVMRCDYCRATNFVLRDGETRKRAAPEHCPGCSAQLFPGKTTSGMVWGCGNCGGIWLDLANCKAIASGKGGEVAQLARRAASNAAQRPKAGRAPRKCSVCDNPMGMTRVLQGRFSVDACGLHGTFFDAGEVEAIVVAMSKPADREMLLQHARPPLRYEPVTDIELREYQAGLWNSKAFGAGTGELQRFDNLLQGILNDS